MRYYINLTHEEIKSSFTDLLVSVFGEIGAQSILKSIGYLSVNNLNELTIEDCSISCMELLDKTYVCAINLANPIYLPNKCAFKGMDEEQLDLAKYMYGEENLLTTEQRSKLNFKTE